MGGIDEIYEKIRFPQRGTTPRPYVFLNMVQSVDGKATVEGKASGLGTDVDRGVMRTLRSRADAVMVGGGTVRAEKLSLSLDAKDRRRVPRAVILTTTGKLPLESNLVRDRRQKVLVLLPDTVGRGAERLIGAWAETRRVPAAESGNIDVARALEIMKREYDINALLCEGGPKLTRVLIDADLADELFLTVAPVLVGNDNTEEPGGSLRIGEQRPLRLISSHVVRDELFLRYSIVKHH